MVRTLESQIDSGEATKEIITPMERPAAFTVKRLESDNATELLNGTFQKGLRSKSMVHKLSSFYSPDTNGKAERLRQTLTNTARYLLHMNKQLSGRKQVWYEALLAADQSPNRLYASFCFTEDVNIYEAFTGIKPNLSD